MRFRECAGWDYRGDRDAGPDFNGLRLGWKGDGGEADVGVSGEPCGRRLVCGVRRRGRRKKMGS